MHSPDKEPHSDRRPFAAATVPKIVMAEQITHDVVKEAQSMGGPSPIDVSASATNSSAGNGEAPSGPTTLDSKPSDALATTTNTKTKDTAAVGLVQQLDKAGRDGIPVRSAPDRTHTRN